MRATVLRSTPVLARDVVNCSADLMAATKTAYVRRQSDSTLRRAEALVAEVTRRSSRPPAFDVQVGSTEGATGADHDSGVAAVPRTRFQPPDGPHPPPAPLRALVGPSEPDPYPEPEDSEP